MPTYEYRCEQCGDFEQSQRITEPPLERCPKCRRKVRRLISNTSFQLKGGGWYVTDYARSGGGGDGGDKKDATGETAASPSTEGKSQSKVEAKSEAKPETKPEPKPETKPAPKPAPAGEKPSS